MRSAALALMKFDAPKPGRALRGTGCEKYPANGFAIAKHVIVIVGPFAAGAAEACAFEGELNCSLGSSVDEHQSF